MIEYKIIIDPDYTSTSKLGIKMFPDNPIVRFFIAAIGISQFPELIKSVVLSKRFGIENARILFFNEMDWEDKEGLDINLKQLSIYVYDGNPNETVVDELIFDKILYDYSVKLLELHEFDKSLSNLWTEDMQNSIEKLKEKIKA
jgi:hypothetical protein